MKSIYERLDEILPIISAPHFRENKGLGNEVGFYIFDYSPKDEMIVRERIPDSVFDNATQVELVDIEPDDLITRLNKGKIYKEDQVEKALGNFFVKENLVALREIALRRTADRVNKISENLF